MVTEYVDDEEDYRTVMLAYGPMLGRCDGGRLIYPGYICPHCQSANPREECFARRPKATQP